MKNLFFPALALLFTILPMAVGKPVMDWQFNEEPVTGERITDSTGLARGQLVTGKNPEGVPTLVTQDVPSGTAWDFGDSDCVLIVQPDDEIANLGNPSTSKGMAFAFWVKLDNSERSADHRRVFGWKPIIECVAMKDGLLFLTPTGAQAGRDATSSERAVSADGVLDGNWHHVALSAEFAEGDSKVTVFVDGQEVGSSPAAFTTEAWEARARVFTIANRWPGSFGRFQAWNRPLEANEISEIARPKK